MGEVYVSHAHADIERARAIAEHLGAAGVSLWIDREGVRTSDWLDKVARAIRECRVCLVLCSHASMRSEWVRKENDYASAYGVALVTVLLEEAELPSGIRSHFPDAPVIAVLNRPVDEWLSEVLDPLREAGVEVGPAESAASTAFRIFVTTSTTDTARATRLGRALAGRFGRDNVFIDIEDMLPGMPWIVQLRRAVESSDVVVAVVGPDWPTAESDVRSSIDAALELALARDVPVIPVLVQGAAKPRQDELRRDVRGTLPHTQPHTVSDPTFRFDVSRLIDRIADVAREEAERERANTSFVEQVAAYGWDVTRREGSELDVPPELAERVARLVARRRARRSADLPVFAYTPPSELETEEEAEAQLELLALAERRPELVRSLAEAAHRELGPRGVFEPFEDQPPGGSVTVRGFFGLPAPVRSEGLPEPSRGEFRRFAQDIPRKLAAVGYVLRPGFDELLPLEFSNSEVELLARWEHERSVEERVAEGWSFGPKDPRTKTSPDLVPWEALGEETKDRVRTIIRRLPAVLATAGFSAVPLPSDLAEPPGEGPSADEQAEAAEVPSMPDPVDCTVFSPASVPQASAFRVQVFAHLPSQASDAHARATEYDERARPRGSISLETTIERGARLLFRLRMRGLDVDKSVQPLIWQGRAQAVTFGVVVPADHPPGEVLGEVTVRVGPRPVGRTTFGVEVVPAGAGHGLGRLLPTGDAHVYTKPFVSYARKDLRAVSHCVQVLRSVGIRPLHDLDIRRGARWEKELHEFIDQCDVFLLFWSSGAKRSRWVQKEVKYARARRGDDDLAPPAIEPVIIEGPPIPLPWKWLRDVQFDEDMIYRVPWVSV